jgi:hypothetical protein
MKTVKKTIDEKFAAIPVEKDTRVLSRKQVKVGDYDAVHEKWFWEGISAESYIFLSEEIKELSEEEILDMVGEEGATFKRMETYTFVNFNFQTPY